MKRIIGDSVREKATEMFISGISAQEIVASCGISTATLYRWIGKYCKRCEQPSYAKVTTKHPGVYPFFDSVRMASEESAAIARRFSVEYRLGKQTGKEVAAP